MTVIGRAMPALEADLAEGEDWRSEAFGLMFRALDDLKPADVYLHRRLAAPRALERADEHWGDEPRRRRAIFQPHEANS
jgi:hypothetical protein